MKTLTHPLAKSSISIAFDYSHSQHVFLVCDSWKCFGHNVGDHVAARTVPKVNFLCRDLIANKMILNVDMLRTCVIFWVSS